MRNIFLFHHLATYTIKVIFLLLILNVPAIAEPAQRIIITFSHALSTDDTEAIHIALNNHIPDGYSLADTSTSERWIIILNRRINFHQLEEIKVQLLKNKLITNIEEDNILEKKIIIQAQLRPL